MLDFGNLVSTVQTNCHISDARHAGDFTLCIYLLKMRELYRWENDIPLTQTLPTEDVGTWLQEREQLWDTLESRPFTPLPLERGARDPFDSCSINLELVPRNYVYSAGYGRLNKPHFFLGRLIRREQRGCYTIYVSSCEYARDLEAPPAMLQGAAIFVRQESVRRFLWEKIDEQRWSRSNAALQAALAHYEFDLDTDSALTHMTEHETETTILHEIGEGFAGERLGSEWEEMLAGFSRSRAEIMARAVRDLLADCLSTLPALIDREDAASLHFYFANFGGMRRHLFPEAVDAYRKWTAEGRFDPLHLLAETGVERWLTAARAMLDLHRTRGIEATAAIETLIDPHRGPVSGTIRS
jgi:hypothetical protein